MSIRRAYIGEATIKSFQRGGWQKFRTGQLITGRGEVIRVTILRDEDGVLSFDRRHDCKDCHPALEYAQKHWWAKDETAAAKMYWDALDFAEFGCVSPSK